MDKHTGPRIKLDFEQFRGYFRKRWESIKDRGVILTTDVDGEKLWETWLETIPAERNPIFITRREYDCNSCRHFIRRYGGIVVVDDELNIHSMWDFSVPDADWQNVIDKARDMVLASEPVGYFLSNVPVAGNGGKTPFAHLCIDIPDRAIVNSRESIQEIAGKKRSTWETFEISLRTIPLESVDQILELINDNNLLRGLENKDKVQAFRNELERSQTFPKEKLKLYAAVRSTRLRESVTHIRASSIGTLLKSLADGKTVEDAVRAYESIVGGENYRRPKPIYTKAQLDRLQKTVVEMGYADSLPRRFATLRDLSVNDAIFVDRAVKAATASSTLDDVFKAMTDSIAVNPKPYDSDKLPVYSMREFRNDIVPTVSQVELLFSNKLARNLVSLIAPVNVGSKSMFKWENGVSWAYSGNMADSAMRQAVEKMGGSVTGDFRFSIMWNEDGDDDNDLDAHCRMPNGNEIWFSRKVDIPTGGALDVDIIVPSRDANGGPAVENIAFPDRSRMPEGKYKLYVHNFTNRGGRGGVRAEIEFDGNIISYDYPYPIREKESVAIADVVLKNGVFTVTDRVNINRLTVLSKTVWGVSTNQFIPVAAICFSPNYWGVEEGDFSHGAKHTFFLLKGMKNPEKPNGFYNEFLNNDFAEHRRAMEALGARLAVADSDEQLSGVGFAETRHDEVILRLDGKKVIKVRV